MNRMMGSLATSRKMRFHHPYPSFNPDVIRGGGEWCWFRKGCFFTSSNIPSEGNGIDKNNGVLELEEVKEILRDVRADDVKVIPMSSTQNPSPLSSSSPPSSSLWTDYMVVATGRSPWHVRNIAQSLIHRVKEKQKGAGHMVLPRVHGYEGGKWIVVDSGNVVVHALDEKARTYYNLEDLYAKRASDNTSQEELSLLLGQPPEEPPTC